jgi:hypothetical protein
MLIKIHNINVDADTLLIESGSSGNGGDGELKSSGYL